MGFETQKTGRVREHRVRVGLRETLAAQYVEQNLHPASGHVGVGLTCGGLVAEMAPALHHLLG